MFIFAAMCMAKYQTISANGGAAVKEVFKTFPSTIQALFGMNGLDLTTLAGYFGVCFLFIVVILAVHAGLLGTDVLAGEEQDKTTEFLYVKPRSRPRIVVAKLFAGIFCMLIVWASTTLGFVVTIQKFASLKGFGHMFMWFMLGALIIAAVFYALGAFAAAMPWVSARSRIVPIAIFTSYLLYVFAKISDKFGWLHYASIFSYFDAKDIVTTSSLKLHYVVICITISLVLLIGAVVLYRNRDLRI